MSARRQNPMRKTIARIRSHDDFCHILTAIVFHRVLDWPGAPGQKCGECQNGDKASHRNFRRTVLFTRTAFHDRGGEDCLVQGVENLGDRISCGRHVDRVPGSVSRSRISTRATSSKSSLLIPRACGAKDAGGSVNRPYPQQQAGCGLAHETRTGFAADELPRSSLRSGTRLTMLPQRAGG